MPRWKFWEKTDDPPAASSPPRRTATIGQPPPQPPKPGPPQTVPPLNDDARARRRAQLLRRRDAVRFDVEQGELATRPDNPWHQRVALLADSLATVEADRATLDAAPAAPTFPVPRTLVADLHVEADEPARVTFRVGNEAFRFEEEIDWDQRGGPVVRGDLLQRDGNAAALVPADVPDALRQPLADHLVASALVFATDLRDRALAEQPLPAAPTLADLARPCPECGGWADWRNNCPACAEREWRRRQLDAEAERLRVEQAKEEEERHRWADRLPVARRRLADADAELAALDG